MGSGGSLGAARRPPSRLLQRRIETSCVLNDRKRLYQQGTMESNRIKGALFACATGVERQVKRRGSRLVDGGGVKNNRDCPLLSLLSFRFAAVVFWALKTKIKVKISISGTPSLASPTSSTTKALRPRVRVPWSATTTANHDPKGSAVRDNHSNYYANVPLSATTAAKTMAAKVPLSTLTATPTPPSPFP